MSEEGLTEEDGSDGGQFPGRYPKTNKEWAETLLSAAEKYYYAGGDADMFIIQSWHALPKQGLPEAEKCAFMDTARKVINLQKSRKGK